MQTLFQNVHGSETTKKTGINPVVEELSISNVKLPKGKTPIDVEFSHKNGNTKLAAEVTSDKGVGPIVDRNS